ncbi:MAG: OmpA family protein [Acidobacteria bacterium]|nr:OmpA family protein [Acidobacteriota bacterium]
MSRKKKHEHVNHERWLVSYADFITLLFAFFVVLFASSKTDQKKQQMMTQAMQSAFAQNAIFEAHSKTPALAPSAGGSNSPAPLTMPLSSEDAAMRGDALKKEISASLDALPLKGSGARKGDLRNAIVIRTIPEGTVISLKDVGFFDSGSAEIRSDAMDMLQHIASTLPPGRVRVEGHTDNVAIHTPQFRSNWELSTARATAIARVLLEKNAVNPASLSIAGYGEFHPIASNATEEGRAVNRRVDIVLLRDEHGVPAKPQNNTIAEVSPSSLPKPSR